MISNLSESDSFFSPNGVFRCERPEGDGCKDNHHLCPAFFEGDLIKLGDFELYHKIERKKTARFVVEHAKDIFASAGLLAFDSSYIFSLLFTRVNLNLVYKKCHNKKDHHTSVSVEKAIVPRALSDCLGDLTLLE